MPANRSSPRQQAGFGLAEIMVALAIGLISTLVIMQVTTAFEGQKRTTSGNTDAQTNGSIALYTIQRRLQAAGFGLPVYSQQNQPLNCDPSPTLDDDGNAATPSIGIFPVTIIDGGNAAGASDQIIIRSSSSPTGGAPITISNVIGNTLSVANNMGCRANDIALIMNGTAACVMRRVTGLTDTTQITLQDATNVATGAEISCMTGWGETLYQVDNKSNLTENGAPSVASIVNIQAQYGISNAPNNSQVNAWVDASGTWSDPAITDRNRIKAIRIAVVARNGLLEKQNVTAACSSTTAASPTGLCAWEGSSTNPAPTIDLSKNLDGTDNPNWQRYRYRVFETIIPLRNLIWSSGSL